MSVYFGSKLHKVIGEDDIVFDVVGMRFRYATIDDNKVTESSLTLQNLMAEILLKGSQQKVNEEQAKAIPAQILQGWEELTKKGKTLIIQREQMEAYTQDVINRYELGKKGLDIEEQKLIKDIVLGMLEIASKGAGAALGAKVGKTGFQ